MGILRGKIQTYAVLIAFLSVCCLVLLITQRQLHQPAAQNDIQGVLNKFASSNQSDALEAKGELLEMGDPAIEPLLSLLQVLINQTGEMHIAAGEGTPMRGKPIVLDKGRPSPATRSRLINDIYEILGRLHAAEAVPLLVTIMEHEEVRDMIQGMSPVMRSLAEIGPAAVPRLIESMDNARNTALGFPELLSPGLSDETRQRRLGWTEGRIELRALLVLEKIGDKRAIPALERLLTTTDNEFILTQANEAIEKIQKKSAQ